MICDTGEEGGGEISENLQSLSCQLPVCLHNPDMPDNKGTSYPCDNNNNHRHANDVTRSRNGATVQPPTTLGKHGHHTDSEDAPSPKPVRTVNTSQAHYDTRLQRATSSSATQQQLPTYWTRQPPPTFSASEKKTNRNPMYGTGHEQEFLTRDEYLAVA